MSLENLEKPTDFIEVKLNAEKKIKLLTVLNAIMLLLLVVLYGLFFFSKKNTTNDHLSANNGSEQQVSSLKIGFVNAEVFNESFKLASKFRIDLEEEQKRLEADITRRQRSFQDDVQKFQSDAQSGSASADALQAKEKELGRRQQELGQLAETYQARLAKREKDMMDEMIKVLRDFFEKYNLTRGYDFILRYTPIFGMYYANDKHDITHEVLEILNAEYDSKKN